MHRTKIICRLKDCNLYHGSDREARKLCKVPTAMIKVCAKISSIVSVTLIPEKENNDGIVRRREIDKTYKTEEKPYFFNDATFLKSTISMPKERNRPANFKAMPEGFIITGLKSYRSTCNKTGTRRQEIQTKFLLCFPDLS